MSKRQTRPVLGHRVWNETSRVRPWTLAELMAQQDRRINYPELNSPNDRAQDDLGAEGSRLRK